ncbi:MAG: VOC family protein [Patescibacteria group bacterium]
MQKIIPHIWFDTQAKEAAEFYASVFPNSKVSSSTILNNTPSGDCEIMTFNVMGQDFMAISAGPDFKPNPSISFMVNFDPSKMDNAEEELDEIWKKLSDGGMVAMELGEYPFSKKYGWIQDKYGVSWQLILTDPDGEDRPAVIPSFLFVTEGCDKAEEATDFYLSVFKNSKRGIVARYPAGAEAEGGKEGSIMFTDFTLESQRFTATDASSDMHKFAFDEGISLVVHCDTQEEIDYYWEKLSAAPESEQCGWLKDKYGVSWQIVPSIMNEMMTCGDQEKIDRVTEAFIKMKKFDIVKLNEAYNGK